MVKKNDFVIGERYLVRINTEQISDFEHQVIREVIISEFSPSRQYVRLSLYQGKTILRSRRFFNRKKVHRTDMWMWVDIDELEKIEKLDKKGRKE